MKSDKTVCLYNYINEFSLYFTFFGMQDMYTLIVDMNVPLFRLEFSVIISLVYHVYIENIYFCQVYNKLLLLSLIWCWHLNLKLVIWFWSWEFYIIPLKADVLPIGLLSKFATSPFEVQKAVYFIYRLKTR